MRAPLEVGAVLYRVEWGSADFGGQVPYFVHRRVVRTTPHGAWTLPCRPPGAGAGVYQVASAKGETWVSERSRQWSPSEEGALLQASYRARSYARHAQAALDKANARLRALGCSARGPGSALGLGGYGAF